LITVAGHAIRMLLMTRLRPYKSW